MEQQQPSHHHCMYRKGSPVSKTEGLPRSQKALNRKKLHSYYTPLVRVCQNSSVCRPWVTPVLTWVTWATLTSGHLMTWDTALECTDLSESSLMLARGWATALTQARNHSSQHTLKADSEQPRPRGHASWQSGLLSQRKSVWVSLSVMVPDTYMAILSHSLRHLKVSVWLKAIVVLWKRIRQTVTLLALRSSNKKVNVNRCAS